MSHDCTRVNIKLAVALRAQASLASWCSSTARGAPLANDHLPPKCPALRCSVTEEPAWKTLALQMGALLQ